MRDLRALLLCLPALALAAFGASASSDTSGTADVDASAPAIEPLGDGGGPDRACTTS